MNTRKRGSHPSQMPPFHSAKNRRLSPSSPMDSAAPLLPPNSHRSLGRKMKIKAYANPPVLDSAFFEKSWEGKLKPAVEGVLARTALRFSLEELYRVVEDCCMQKRGAELYKRLRRLIEAEVTERVQTLASDRGDPGLWLARVDDAWKKHCDEMLRVRAIFLALDRKYMLRSGEVEKSLWEMALAVWRIRLEREGDVESKLVRTVIGKINGERGGESLDEGRIKSLLRMLKAVGTYDTVFHPPFIEASTRFYKTEAEFHIVGDDVPTYLAHVAQRLGDERQRVIRYLDARTNSSVMHVVEQTMVTDRVSAILEKGFDLMCDDSRKCDLQLCYELFDRVDATNEMRTALVKYVKKVGLSIVMEPSKDREMIQLLLDFKKRLDEMVTESFDGNEVFTSAVKSAFEFFINMRENKPAELLAKFADRILRTGNKEYTEEELEEVLDQTLMLFRYINGKDMFEGFYKDCLCKRLLREKSASLDLEKSMISKLKQECGSQFTVKLEEMFRDIDSSKDLMLGFKQHAESMEAIKQKPDLEVQVLQASRWPLTEESAELQLPRELVDCHSIFNKFYSAKHKGKKLWWLHLNGRCNVIARFPKGQKHLALSVYQTIILCLFNNADELSYSEIKEATRMEEKELQKTLLSLACGKFRVIRKRLKGPTISSEDSFYFNKSFQHKQTRIKINMIQMKETKEEVHDTKQKVFRERTLQIDASIVRIMKTRRKLMHNALITELYGQLRFPLKTADLKRSIESLIEREYLERDSTNPQLYKYLA